MKDDNTISVVDFSDTSVDTVVYPEGYETVMLTTLDNPFSPFDDYERWNWYDLNQNYRTNELLARLIGSSSEFDQTELGRELDNKFYYSTLLDIIRFNDTTPYVLASEGDYTEDGVYKYYTPTVYQKLLAAAQTA